MTETQKERGTEGLVGVMDEARGPSRDAMSEFRRLYVDLPLAHSQPYSESINVNHGEIENALVIVLQRTIRVPDNRDTNSLPPSMGPFPLFKVQDYATRMPEAMAAKGGLFFPMYQREAMWISFSAAAPFALKIYVGGVNAISGFPMVENNTTREKRRQMLEEGKQIQDYVVVPGQPWLDGIASEDGKIRQFVAQPKGSGFSVEAQVTGEEKVGGIQFEVIPIKHEMPEEIDVRFQNHDGQVITRTLNLAEKGITAQSTWHDLKKLLRDEFDVAIQHQTIDLGNGRYGSYQSRDDLKLGNLYFKPGATVELTEAHPEARASGVKRKAGLHEDDDSSEDEDGGEYEVAFADDLEGFRGGMKARKREAGTKSAPQVQEMGLAAGGLIKQSIVPDPHPGQVWDVEAAIMFNLQILDAESFSEVTGLPAPSTPVDAKTYSQYKYPFFEIWNEPKTGVKGKFSEVKSVAQIEAERAKEKGELYKEEASVPQRVVLLGGSGKTFNSTFRPVEVLRQELESLKL